jgi:DNA (cytosine-5)-methyltransferase 1
VGHVILDVVDIDKDSIEKLKLILEKINVPHNFTINIICQDFLMMDIPYRYDLAVGNPPFSKLNDKHKDIAWYLLHNLNQNTRNLSEMFLEKCIRCSDCVALVLNKTLLCTGEFDETRDLLRGMKIDSIIDFGRNGFTGRSIETMCLIVYPKQKPDNTIVYSMKHNLKIYQKQEYITDSRFPYFIIYRDRHFDIVADKLEFDLFTVFRDRQITKAVTTCEPASGKLWVIKAKNITNGNGNSKSNNNGKQGVTHIPNYDVWLSEQIAKSLAAYKYVNDSSVYLTQNMTYYPRVIKNLPDTIPDGSVAVLIPKVPLQLSAKQRAYFSTEEYKRFYEIARNLSTQSINVDKKSVFFYGVLKNDT